MKTKLTAIVCLVLAGALIFSGCGMPESTEDAKASASPSATTGVIVAEVAGEPIYYDDYYTQLSNACAQFGISPEDENAAMLKDSVVESMVNEKVLTKMLTEKGYMNLTDEQIAEAEKNAEADVKSYIEGNYKEDIETALGEGYTEEQYASELETHKQQLLTDIGMTWAELVESYKMGVAQDAAMKELANEQPTDEDIRKEYDTNVASDKATMDEDPSSYESALMYGSPVYYVPEGVRTVKQVLIKIDDKDSEAISMLRENEYEEQANQLLEKALENIKAKADEVLQKIQSGSITFDQAITDYNEDEGMTEEGYAVTAGSTTYMEPFTTASMALAKVGDITELVTTDYGYHIIQYAADVTPGAVDFETVKDDIKENLTSTMQEEAWSAVLDEWNKECNVQYYKENY